MIRKVCPLNSTASKLLGSETGKPSAFPNCASVSNPLSETLSSDIELST